MLSKAAATGMQGIKPSWSPPPPPKCPRILAQTLPRRPGRLRVNQSVGKIHRKRVCPPMQLIHPGVVTCLLSAAPRLSSPSRIPNGGGMLRIPRVFCPPAPLDRFELPQLSIFEPTSPVLCVGRTGDGGMPRSISPCRAQVLPPLSLPRTCAGRIAAAPRASPGLAPTPAPPRIVMIPTGDINAPLDLVEEARAVFSLPEELSPWFAAAFDLPCARPMRSGLLAIKPLRAGAPLPFPTPHSETGRNDGGVLTNNGGVFANFGNAPTIAFTAGIQEAMYDVPQNADRPVPPSDAAPCVPAVSDPMLAAWASAGMAAVRSEQPCLVAGIDEAVSLAFEYVTAGFSLVGVTTKPPQPIEREAVMPRSMYVTEAAAYGYTAKAGHYYPGNGYLQIQEAGRPTWRDWSSNGDEAARCLRSVGPVWRDSDELLEAEHAAPSLPHPWAGPQKSPDLSLPRLATQRLQTRFAVSRGVFSMDPTLRRKRTQYSTCVSGKLETKQKGPLCGGKVCNTKAACLHRKRPTGAAVWKDALKLPRGVHVDTERPSAIGAACAEEPSGTNVHGFSGYQPEIQDSIRTVHGGPVPFRSPPRARKGGRGTRSKVLTLDDALPIVVQHRPGGTHVAQTQSRMFGNQGFLSLASSSASVWKSIASIPEDPPPLPRPRPSGRSRRKGREKIEQRRTFLSEGRSNVGVNPRTPPVPWRTPPFS